MVGIRDSIRVPCSVESPIIWPGIRRSNYALLHRIIIMTNATDSAYLVLAIYTAGIFVATTAIAGVSLGAFAFCGIILGLGLAIATA